ncbi:unnamed protein product [Parnassius mnemosyne]|uniref:MADF domain-containing protein n=1 Tax=Parnassius mnemosyne TaxID=213953 RepID=A0AAV1KMW1_9NEOP
MASWSREFLLDFIELFKTLEPLWLIKSKDYCNKNKRNECYDLLLNKVLTIEPSANRVTITKKINNLHSTFRKEHKKVISSIVLGASADEVYTPKLWYYKELLFLKDQKKPLPSTSSMDVNVEHLHKVESSISFQNRSQFQSNLLQIVETVKKYISLELSLSSNSRSFKRKQPSNSESQSILRTIGDRLSSIRQEDEFDIIGKNVGSKLRSLSAIQNIYAEKIMNVTLYEAQLNNLSRFSLLSNPLPNLDYANSVINRLTQILSPINNQPVFRGTPVNYSCEWNQKNNCQIW